MTSVKIRRSLLNGSVTAPPSKSYTHRAITSASLVKGRSDIFNALISRDTEATIEACRAFGSRIECQESKVVVEGDGMVKTPEDIIDAENSGTTIRFMTAISSLTPEGYTVLTGDSSIRRRPMEPLLKALRRLGVECWSSRMNGTPPIIVKGGGLEGGGTQIRSDISSQFISALLIAAPKADKDTSIEIEGRPVSETYIEATEKTLELFGVRVEHTAKGYFIPSRQSYSPVRFTVPGDFSSASFVLAAGALSGGRVTVKGLDFNLPQSDRSIIDILKSMGVKVEVDIEEGSVAVEGCKDLVGGRFDLSDSPDLLPVVSMLALKCREDVVISGVKHARYKETDRIAVLSSELRRLGADVTEFEDGLRIGYQKLYSTATLNAYDDHRMFMAFCLAGMVLKDGVIVNGLESMDVSYPKFLKDLASLGGRVEVLGS